MIYHSLLTMDLCIIFFFFSFHLVNFTKKRITKPKLLEEVYFYVTPPIQQCKPWKKLKNKANNFFWYSPTKSTHLRFYFKFSFALYFFFYIFFFYFALLFWLSIKYIWQCNSFSLFHTLCSLNNYKINWKKSWNHEAEVQCNHIQKIIFNKLRNSNWSCSHDHLDHSVLFVK